MRRSAVYLAVPLVHHSIFNNVMCADNPLQLLQTGFWVALGATSNVLELIQDSQKREDTLTKLQKELNQHIQDWETSGEQIEEKTRNFFETLFSPSHPASQYPSYVNRGGEQVFPQPFIHHGAKLHAFLLSADYKHLQSLCDKYLNHPLKGRTRYYPLTSFVALVFADIAAIDIPSVYQPGTQAGQISEIDVAFWIPVVAGKQVGDLFVIERLAWFQPYIFVDNPWAMATGREVYGFPKELGKFQIPDSYQSPAVFTVDTLVLDHFSPQTWATQKRLLEVHRIDEGLTTQLTQTVNSLEEAFQEIIQQLFGNGIIEIPGLRLFINLFDHLLNQEVPMVFLKQFRDVKDSKRACYQAVVEAPAKLLTFRTGGFLPGEYQLRLNDFDSHPMIQELGLKAEQPVLAALQLDFDFLMEKGVEIKKAIPK